jgi:Major Facilitator Superfamily
LQPLMLAVMSAVFIIPGVIGPSVAAVVATTIGWRWIFGAIIPLLGLCAVLLIPEITRLEARGTNAVATPEPTAAMPKPTAPTPTPTPTANATPGPVRSTTEADRRSSGQSTAPSNGRSPGATNPPWWGPPALAGGLMTAVVAGSAQNLRWLPLAAAGVGLAVAGAAATLPAGTWRARPGLPSAVACALAITLAYITAEQFLPLLLNEVRGRSLFAAAFPLTIAAFLWTAGSWLQARLAPAQRRSWARIGGALVALGLATDALLVFDGVPYWLAYPATAVASFGCGLVFTICQVTAIEWAAAGREGEASGSVQLANLLGAAIGTGVTAVLIAHLKDHLSFALGLSLVGTTGAALVAALAGGRLPTTAGPIS